MTRPSRAPDVVAATLRRRILSGELAPGDSLPTEGELITQLGVSRETVLMALRLLDAEGLTTTSQGRSGAPVSAANDALPTNSRLAGVCTTRTSCPAAVARRTSSSAL